MDYILTTNQLTKIYGDNAAVSHLNMHVKRGSIYGFLGPNGSGKSTTMKMMMNLVKPTEGSITMFGKKPGGEFSQYSAPRISYDRDACILRQSIGGTDAADSL